MTEPHPALQPLLHTIETVVSNTWKEYPRLSDKDIELTYEQLKEYFRKVSQGKDVDAPVSAADSRMTLIDAILDAIEVREDLHADDHLVMSPNFQPAGYLVPSLESLYVMAFNRLVESVRFWRKEAGRTGYLKYISHFL